MTWVKWMNDKCLFWMIWWYINQSFIIIHAVSHVAKCDRTFVLVYLPNPTSFVSQWYGFLLLLFVMAGPIPPRPSLFASFKSLLVTKRVHTRQQSKTVSLWPPPWSFISRGADRLTGTGDVSAGFCPKLRELVEAELTLLYSLLRCGWLVFMGLCFVFCEWKRLCFAFMLDFAEISGKPKTEIFCYLLLN